MKNLLLVLIVMISVSACKKKDKQEDVDKEIILKYIADHNLNAIEGEEGLFYVVDEAGSGDACKSNSTIKTTYKGYLTNGNVFDEGTIDNFALGNAIRGWQLGMPKYKEGGNGILLIPSHLGYGANGSLSGSIPGNAVIIFDVELIKVY
jgi:FKBP-type peptidyl-prolyl cis-trans isomerase